MMQIRQARPEDAHFIVQSQIAMAMETEGLRLDPAIVEKGVSAVFDDLSIGAYYVAKGEEGALLGCLLTLPEWSDWRNGKVIWIHSVYILPAFRRQGVFRKLYAHLRALVESDVSLRGLRLYVERKNSNAQAVYVNFGMTKEHYELYEWLK
jgi:GNAT superfamily N-acetyltransferase